MLNQWATEGRILADTVLIESGTNRQVPAKDLPQLRHHFQLHATTQQQVQQPPPDPYNPPQPGQTTHQPYQPGGHPQPGQPGYNPYQNPPSPYQSSQPNRATGIVGPRKNKVVAAVLAFILGVFGVHRFYLGYTQLGIIMLAIGLIGGCLCGFGALITTVWGIYDGIMILTDKMPDSDGQPLE